MGNLVNYAVFTHNLTKTKTLKQWARYKNDVLSNKMFYSAKQLVHKAS